LITTALLILLIAAVALIGGLLGSKIAKLEKNVTPSSTTNDGNSSTPTATGPQPAFTTNTRITGFRYVGCYVDANDRVLRQHSFQANNMTNQVCAGACTEKANYKYFGTESGDQCYCGDSLPEGVADLKANEWNCGMGCAGSQAKKQEICGGDYFVGIWERV
ncbi:WSC domain-containing protein, partial [Cladorrhinum samala]